MTTLTYKCGLNGKNYIYFYGHKTHTAITKNENGKIVEGLMVEINDDEAQSLSLMIDMEKQMLNIERDKNE